LNGTIQNVVGPTLVAMATKLGLKSPIIPLVRQIGRRSSAFYGIFGDGRFSATINLVRLTLVAMAATFALGAESNRLPACLSVPLSVTLLQIASSFLFLNGIEPFLAVIFPCASLQNVFLRFLI